MGFTRSSADLKIIQKLSDYPNMEDGLSSEELKKKFDEAAEILQGDLNKVVEELEAITGAANVGATPLGEGDTSNSDIQAKLEYLLSQIQAQALGQIPDGSVTKAKLESEYANVIAEKNGEEQENLNAEMIGGKTYANLQEEMANQKNLYVEDSFTFELPTKISEVLTKEYDLDDTRIILLCFAGSTNDGDAPIAVSVLFDCATNTIINLINYKETIGHVYFMKQATGLSYSNFTYTNSPFGLTLNRISYNQETKKLTIEYIKKNSMSYDILDNSLNTKIYGMSQKI